MFTNYSKAAGQDVFVTIWKVFGDLDLIDREDGSLIVAQSGYIIYITFAYL